MYQNIYIERGEQWGQDTVHLWDDMLGYKTMPYSQFAYAYKADNNGQYISMTNVRLAKVKRYKRDDPNVFESDLPQETRVLTDLYLNEDNASVGHKVLFFDIEVSMTNGVPRPDNPNNEITSIAYYDSVIKQYTILVVDQKGNQTNREKDDVRVLFYPNEMDLLYAFLDQYEEISPTIVSGWNSDYFDVPYLYNRIKQQCGYNTGGRLSPIGKLKFSKFRLKWQIAGVASLDYLDLYKKFTYIQQPNYRLDSIGKLELGLGKIEYEGTLDQLFAEDIEKFIEYNIRDVLILVKLDEKLKLIDLAREICHLGHVPYEDYWYSSKFLEGTIITYLHRKGIISTNKPVGGREMMAESNESSEEGYEGAYVKPPFPALYENVYSLDLQSLYPSIIMSLNISPETKLGTVTNWNIDKHLKNELSEYLIRGVGEEKSVSLTRSQFVKYMNGDKLTISSNGILYNTANPGIIPEILDKWFTERIEFKTLMKKYADEGNTELATFYDRRQHIQKIFLNSLYGVLGLPIFRFFDLDNALAVTASGQDVIKRSARYLSDIYVARGASNKTDGWLLEYQLVLKQKKYQKLTAQEINELLDPTDHCIYIDTDSLYFSTTPFLKEGMDALGFTIKMARAAETALNAYYDSLSKDAFFCESHRLRIKGESVSKTGIWITKKRYALNVIYDLEKNEDVSNKMKVKGLDAVRSSFPTAFRDFMTGMMKRVLLNATKEEVDASILEFRTKLNDMHYLEVARNTAVQNVSGYDIESDTFGEFEKGAPAHVKASITYNLMLRKLGLEKRYPRIVDGEKIKWVYLTDNPYKLEAIAIRGDNDPPEIVKFVTTYIDYNSLFEKELELKLEGFYGALKWGNIPTKVNQNANDWFV